QAAADGEVLDFLFFFQAEDGIRDRNVTGVQTCALPISSLVRRNMNGRIFVRSVLMACCDRICRCACVSTSSVLPGSVRATRWAASMGRKYSSRKVANLGSMPGTTSRNIDHRSDRVFSIGVPVM